MAAVVEVSGVRFHVAPSDSEWYYSAVVDRGDETDTVDGYASGAKPTRTALQTLVTSDGGARLKILEWSVRRTRK